jgi:hypothetical protein
MQVSNCKRSYDFIFKDYFDITSVEKAMITEFGQEEINQSKRELSNYFNKEVKNLRTYFELLDTRVAEIKQSGGGD